ncbi:MAG: M23 family metallopeptidase, partial [Sporomusa sp.]
MKQKTSKTEAREYTLMLVPHHAKSVFSVRIPLIKVKYAAIALCICLSILSGTMLNYHYQTKISSQEKLELSQLREENSRQLSQLAELAKTTAQLQDDMNRLNQLDGDLRRMINGEESAAGVSRSAPVRVGNYSGQGGPEIQPSVSELTNF